MLTVIDPGLLCTVQDLGRWGCERLGVPVAGAIDPFALRAANHLVGNPPEAAGLEALSAGPLLYAQADCLAAAGGPGFGLEVDGRAFPAWLAVFVRAGQTLRLVNPGGGCWGYLALAGGLQTPLLMGSRATYLRGHWGGLDGRALQAGDALPVLQHERSQLIQRAGVSLLPWALPTYPSPETDEPLTLEVIAGPQTQAFSAAGLETFTNSPYHVTPASDRMGYRLQGAALPHVTPADILSEPIALGAVQIPGDGQPIVMCSDRQTSGGYTKIATLARADLPRLVQLIPGSGQVRFRWVSVEAAQARWRGLVRGIAAGLSED